MLKGILINRTLPEKIENKKLILNLLESDKKAYSENVDDALLDCKKRLQDLRKENSRLRKQLFEKLRNDEKLVNQAFQKNSSDKKVLANKTIHVVLDLMNSKVCGEAKQLNLMKYVSSLKNLRLERLNAQYDNLCIEVQYVQDTLTGVSECGQEMRSLENRLDKAKLKCNEAKEINKVYIKIKYKLQEEYLHYGNDLDSLEDEINLCQKDLCQLKVILSDSLMARDFSVKILKKKEDEVFVDRKRREKELVNMKKAVEEKDNPIEKAEKRMEARDSNEFIEDEMIGSFRFNEAREEKILHYDDLYRKFQDVSGVINIEEAVLRWKNQDKTEICLKKIINGLEKQCIKKRDEKNRYINLLKCKEFNTDSKLFYYELNLGEKQRNFEYLDKMYLEMKEDLTKMITTMVLCKLSGEHLDEILPTNQSCTTENSKHPESNTKTDVFDKCLDKVDVMMDELRKYDYLAYIKNKNLDTFQASVLKNLPMYNTRIILNQQLKDFHDEEDQESDEENDVPTRSLLKKQAFQFVESKIKKKNPKKKKKAKDK